MSALINWWKQGVDFHLLNDNEWKSALINWWKQGQRVDVGFDQLVETRGGLHLLNDKEWKSALINWWKQRWILVFHSDTSQHATSANSSHELFSTFFPGNLPKSKARLSAFGFKQPLGNSFNCEPPLPPVHFAAWWAWPSCSEWACILACLGFCGWG